MSQAEIPPDSELPINKIIHGDCLEVLKSIDDESIDCIITDPPYGYSFMCKDWDKAVVSVQIWKECLRVLKAGSFAFIMSAPRQDVLSHMIVNLANAGFKTDFTSIYWTYASGFPKAANTSKMLQKQGKTKPKLDGSYLGFQPKPALEVILTVMRPLSEKNYVEQALKNGKGITWLDDCRIPFKDEKDIKDSSVGYIGKPIEGHTYHYSEQETKTIRTDYNSNEKGRFPANLLVSDDALNGHSKYFDLDAWYKNAQFIITPKASASERNKGLENEQKKIVDCLEGNKDDSFNKRTNGKPSTHQNYHPTVKPIKLMSYLVTLGSRENDIILDPFVGSGTTCISAYQLHRKFIGIEKEKEYYDIATTRLKPYLNQTKLLNDVTG